MAIVKIKYTKRGELMQKEIYTLNQQFSDVDEDIPENAQN
jgi:hypothetical protein